MSVSSLWLWTACRDSCPLVNHGSEHFTQYLEPKGDRGVSDKLTNKWTKEELIGLPQWPPGQRVRISGTIKKVISSDPTHHDFESKSGLHMSMMLTLSLYYNFLLKFCTGIEAWIHQDCSESLIILLWERLLCAWRIHMKTAFLLPSSLKSLKHF